MGDRARPDHRRPDRAILDHPALPPAPTRRYGPGPDQVYELFGDPATATAWVLLVHGGFWRGLWDRSHLRPLAQALAEEGYAVALPEYVRSGMPGGGWPGTFRDVAEALAVVRREAGAAPLALVGHSAGGHLAVWLLHEPEAGGVRGAVSLAGCLDLTMVAELGLDDGAAVDLMGGRPAELPEAYAAADPRLRGAAPYPVVVVHGTEDEQVPLDVAESWWATCATPGRDRLEVLEGTGHFALIDPWSDAYGLLTDRLRRLLGVAADRG